MPKSVGGHFSKRQLITDSSLVMLCGFPRKIFRHSSQRHFTPRFLSSNGWANSKIFKEFGTVLSNFMNYLSDFKRRHYSKSFDSMSPNRKTSISAYVSVFFSDGSNSLRHFVPLHGGEEFFYSKKIISAE